MAKRRKFIANSLKEEDGTNNSHNQRKQQEQLPKIFLKGNAYWRESKLQYAIIELCVPSTIHEK